MLPRNLADLTFTDGPPDRWERVARRVTETLPPCPPSDSDLVVLLGADAIGLVLGLVGEGHELVCVDSSRTALARARDAVDEPGRVEFLAQDPRELEISSKADIALVVSLTLRAIVLREDRLRVLRAMRSELKPDGALCIELEELPDGDAGSGATPRGTEVSWRRLTDPVEVLRISAISADGPELTGLDVACFDVDQCRAELRDAGFGAVATSEVGGRVWLVARGTGGDA